MRAHAWLLAAALAGCQSPSVVRNTESQLGDPNGDYPNYDERVVLYATNRARTDPAKAGWSQYPAQPPLQWDYQLNRSSRAHSIDMRDTPCFQHNSCDGTDIWQRITSYYTTPYRSIGENISAGVPDGVTAVYNWIYEIGAAPGETGHRENIFSADFTLLGAGFADGGTDYDKYWTEDFIGNPVAALRLVDGIHFPRQGASGGAVTFGATFHDAGGGGASRMQVIVDGQCHDLGLRRGTAANASYETDLALADGCHAYYFRATVGGVDSLYPDTGSLSVGFGAGCPLFAAGQLRPGCDGVPPAGSDGGAPNLGPDPGPTNGGDGGGNGNGGANPPATTTGGCALAPGAPPVGSISALLWLALWTRRRRAT